MHSLLFGVSRIGLAPVSPRLVGRCHIVKVVPAGCDCRSSSGAPCTHEQTDGPALRETKGALLSESTDAPVGRSVAEWPRHRSALPSAR